MGMKTTLTDGREVFIRFKRPPRGAAWKVLVCELVGPRAESPARAGVWRAVYGRGVAICDPSDRWDPEVGRRLALTRAVAGLGRPDRTLVWKAYHERPRTPGALKVVAS